MKSWTLVARMQNNRNFTLSHIQPIREGPINEKYLSSELERHFDFWWEQRESNPRPSACKADALNQLSYAPELGMQIYDYFLSLQILFALCV